MMKLRSLFLITAMVLFFTVCAFAQKIGVQYGSREPHTCSNMTQPVKGAITAEQAKQYLQCRLEGVLSQQLYLVDGLSVTVGGGTAFQARNFPYDNDIDPNYPVYPIRASYKLYQIGSLKGNIESKGKNATMYVVEKAQGVCVRTTFGDWRCTVTGGDTGDATTKYNVAPPQ